jgi:hypothetical protein
VARAAWRRRAWLAALLCAPGLPAAAFDSLLDPAAARPSSKLTVVSTRGLAFGTFAAGTGGTITIAPNGARTRAGGVILVASSPSSSAGYQVSESKTGIVTNVVILTLPADGGVTLLSGTNSMTLSGFTSDKPLVTTLVGGNLTVSLGATLTVGANQPRGKYTGSIPLTVEYQ